MNNLKIFKIIIGRFLLLFLFFPGLPGFNAYGQDDMIAGITGKFERFVKAMPREEIFLHTDRSMYIAGEEIWFKAYLIDRLKEVPSSRIAYVEILNADNRPVVQKRILLEEGNGPGLLTLPDTLSTGRYTLRAYTNWMKNFLPGNCFTQQILIYNALSSGTISIPDELPDNPEPETQINSPEIRLQVDNQKPDLLILEVAADSATRSETSRNCYVFIQSGGKILYKTSLIVSDETTYFKIDKKFLLPGVNQIALFNSEGNPVAERNVFISGPSKEAQIVRIPEGSGSRELISLELELDPGKNFDLSVSVAPASELHNPDLTDYMVFGSEYGDLPDEIRGKSLNEIPTETLDKFLSGVNSKWINWKRIISEELPEIRYPVESEGHYITGKLLNPSGNLSGKYLFISSPGKNATFRYSKTDNDGYFMFDLPISEEINDIIIQPENPDKNTAVKIESSFSEEYLSSQRYRKAFETDASKYLKDASRMSVNYQVTRIYESSSTGKPVSKTGNLPEIRRFYGKPDLELSLNDYIQLPVMEEVFFELTPGVALKNKKSAYTMSVADPVSNREFDKPPLMLVDGVVVKDASVIAALDPEKIEQIDVVKDIYLVGDYMMFGIVNVISSKGDYSLVTLPDYAVRLKYRVIDPVLSFATPDYSTAAAKQSRIPDFRNLLYWNPSLVANSDGKCHVEFWSSDIAGIYEVNIQGITEEGRPVSIRRNIEIY